MTNRLAIVDDDAALLSSLVRLFSQTDDFQVVGAYGSAEEAVAEADWSGVDLLLTASGSVPNNRHCFGVVACNHDSWQDLSETRRLARFTM